MGYPFYKRFPRDFFEGTIGMPFEVKAAYGLLLDLIYLRDGRLPDDPRFIAGHLGLSVRKWNTIRSALIAAGKISSDLGIISNSRADNLTIERRLSADNREINEAVVNKNNDLQAPRAGVRARASEPEPERTTLLPRDAASDDWPEGKSLDHARLICEHVSTVYLDLARSPGLIQSLGRLHAWRRDGASWEHDVLPTLSAKMQGRRSPISTWAYFDQPIAESIAANRAALTIPEFTDDHRPRSSRSDDAVAARRRGGLEALAALEREDAERNGSVGRDYG